MNIKIEDAWAEAVCRQPQYEAWMRRQRASMWDYHVEGETPQAKEKRHFRAKGLCFSCPLRRECLARHDELVAAKGERVSGIWGGRLYVDRDRDNQAAAA